MRLSQVSTQSLFGVMRQSMSALQKELVEAQHEATTGLPSDVGIKLGRQNERRVSLELDIERLGSIVDTNSLSRARLEATLSASSAVSDIGQNLLSALTTSIGQSSTGSVAAAAGKSALSSITSLLNTTLNGEFIFGGINTSSEPIRDFEDGGAQAALDTAFLTHFGFSKTDPAAVSISKPAMEGFLNTVVTAFFQEPDWSANFSDAANETINSRISLSETTTASFSANEQAFRDAVFAAVIVAEFLEGPLGSGARDAVVEKSIGLVANSTSGIASLQGQAGFYANRIEQTSERLTTLIDEFTKQADEIAAVDPYEAATRLNSLLTQIETSYTLTGRLQQLSLMRFI